MHVPIIVVVIAQVVHHLSVLSVDSICLDYRCVVALNN